MRLLVCLATLLVSLGCKENPAPTADKVARKTAEESIALLGEELDTQKTGKPDGDAKDASSSAEKATKPPEPAAPPPPPEGMLLVPGGVFVMGLDDENAIRDERHEHEVTLTAFYLDKTEVTNAAYAKCVEAGVCRRPKEPDTEKAGYAPLAQFRTPDRPVSSVSQADAARYCAWVNKRLPREAEFERAARGDDDRLYPWGNDPPRPELAVYGQSVTEPVGSRPEGAGPYGHLDLTGNVWEWTSDLYDPLAYERETADRGIPGTCPQIKRAQDQLRAQGK